MIRKVSAKRLKANAGKFPFSKRSQIRKKPRKPSEFKRIYGSKQRVEWVKSLPCSACGVVGYSENAHVAPASEKGTGYKADAEWIAPLCGTFLDYGVGGWLQSLNIGCHKMYDEHRDDFDEEFPDFNPEEAARTTNEAWMALSGVSPNNRNAE